MYVDRFPNRLVNYNGEDYLYFGGTSYLGMATEPDLIRSISDNIKKWGTFYGSSRNSNVKLPVYSNFETFFSNFVDVEASLTTSSGTLAAKIVLDYLRSNNFIIYEHPSTHPALHSERNQRLFEDNKINSNLQDNTIEKIAILCDAIPSFEVNPINISFLDNISKTKEVILIVDESHTIGLLGENGKGISGQIPHSKPKHIIMVASLGKALGLSAGIICGDSAIIDDLKKSPTFITSSGPNAAYLQSFIDCHKIYLRKYNQLINNLRYFFTSDINKSQIKFSINYPVLYSNDKELYEKLLKYKIMITHFNYPESKILNRIVINANHTYGDLDKMKSALSLI